MPFASEMCKACFLACKYEASVMEVYHFYDCLHFFANLKISVYKPSDVLIFELCEALLLLSFVQHCGIG